MKVTKAAGVELSGAPSEEQLEKINRLTKTKVTAEDVYVFSVRLCDDQVDRDDERFSEACIRELAALFVGKTGIMDHAWSAEKQVARIFDTEVLTQNGVTMLKGWAYMLRGAETGAHPADRGRHQKGGLDRLHGAAEDVLDLRRGVWRVRACEGRDVWRGAVRGDFV